MKIKKIGHCCLLIQLDGLTILTDPGNFTVEQNKVTGIDVVLITHEHGDHLHIESVKEVLKNNPQAKIITNSGVGANLKEAGIAYQLLEGKDGTATTKIKNVLLEAYDGKHVEIFEEIGQVQNTGYFIDGKLFYPGDAYTVPAKPVDTLALPVAGPWCKIADAIRYALAVKPKKAFPVHDAVLRAEMRGFSAKLVEPILAKNGTQFISMGDGDEKEF